MLFDNMIINKTNKPSEQITNNPNKVKNGRDSSEK